MEQQPTSQTFYVERHVAEDATLDPHDHSFVATDAEAPFDNVSRTFYLRKKREADDIKLSDLTPRQQALFVGAGGSDATEWKKDCTRNCWHPACQGVAWCAGTQIT